MASRLENQKNTTEFTQRPLITAESLLASNQSPEANLAVNEWYSARSEKRLLLKVACGDARPRSTSEPSATLNAIAAAVESGNFDYLLNYHGINRILIEQHFDGTDFIPGTIPAGCGGRKAKENLVNGAAKSPGTGVLDFIERYVLSHDPILQGIKTAANLARITRKPILVTTIDHISEKMYPLAAITNQGKNIHACIGISTLWVSSKYDPTNVYGDGIPTIDVAAIPEEFGDIISENRNLAERFHTNYLDFEQSQKVQNPQIMIITTSIITPKRRFPILERPNSVFTLTLPYIKEEGQVVGIDPGKLKNIKNQAEYAISNKLTGHGFSDMTTVLFDTRDMQTSRAIAEVFLQESWMQQWREQGGAILTGATEQGTVLAIEEYTK